MMFLQNQTKANRTSYLNFFQTSTLLIQEMPLPAKVMEVMYLSVRNTCYTLQVKMIKIRTDYCIHDNTSFTIPLQYLGFWYTRFC